MRISDWSSDVCSSDLESMQRLRVRPAGSHGGGDGAGNLRVRGQDRLDLAQLDPVPLDLHLEVLTPEELDRCRRVGRRAGVGTESAEIARAVRSEEHTSELQSLMRISYAGFCCKKKK